MSRACLVFWAWHALIVAPLGSMRGGPEDGASCLHGSFLSSTFTLPKISCSSASFMGPVLCRGSCLCSSCSFERGNISLPQVCGSSKCQRPWLLRAAHPAAFSFAPPLRDKFVLTKMAHMVLFTFGSIYWRQHLLYSSWTRSHGRRHIDLPHLR